MSRIPGTVQLGGNNWPGADPNTGRFMPSAPPQPGYAQGRIVPGMPGSPSYQPPQTAAPTPLDPAFGGSYPAASGGARTGIGPSGPVSGAPVYPAYAGNANGTFTPWAPDANNRWGPVAPPVGTPNTPQQPQQPQQQIPLPQLPAMPQIPTTPGSSSGAPVGAANNLSSILADIPPLHLPTQQSQNQLLAQAQQRANPVQMLNRMGNSGITTDSAVNIQKLLSPTMQTMQQGALGAANLGIDDQLLRDKHLLQGLTGLGMLENDRVRQGAARERIGLDANQQYLDAIFNMLGGLGNAFNFGNLTSGFGDIAGAF